MKLIFVNKNGQRYEMKDQFKFIVYLILGLLIITVAEAQNGSKLQTKKGKMKKSEIATFASGCFWCSEAIFERVKGVESVVSGYAGGITPNPTYEEVCSGSTGYAESVQITFDPSVVSYVDLLEIFWRTHDPTTSNRQGNDIGTQYRSAIFYHNDEQKKLAEEYKEKLDKSGAWDKPIVTEIVPFTNFYKAEDYHQNYYDNNPHQSYCAYVIAPKLEKFEKVFEDKLKK
jgi:peptide-methionine (S)-S-oxide reductase